MKKLENFLLKNKTTVEKLPTLPWYGGAFRYLLDTKKATEKQKQEIIEKIETSQTTDGGFQLETRGNTGSVVETATIVDFLLDLEIPKDSEIVSKAVKFLLSQQREDGGFAENPNIKHPVEWDDKYIYEKQVSTPHITAWVLRALLKANLSKENSAIAKALNYLKASQKSDGGWSHFKSETKSSPYLTALILIALGEFNEFKQVVDITSAEKYFINRQKENGSIGDCLDASLLVAEAWSNMGIGAQEPNMHKLLEWIKKQQNTDGSFIDKDCGWPDTVKTRTECSMNVLRVMHKTGYTR
jgi:squalene cyclase